MAPYGILLSIAFGSTTHMTEAQQSYISAFVDDSRIGIYISACGEGGEVKL